MKCFIITKVHGSDCQKLWGSMLDRNQVPSRNIKQTSHCLIRLVKGLVMSIVSSIILLSFCMKSRYYSSHFPDEETEVPKNEVIFSKISECSWQTWGQSPNLSISDTRPIPAPHAAFSLSTSFSIKQDFSSVVPQSWLHSPMPHTTCQELTCCTVGQAEWLLPAREEQGLQGSRKSLRPHLWGSL